MPFHIGKANDLLDEATAADNLPEWIPEGYVNDDNLSAIKELGDLHDELMQLRSFRKADGRRVASIPMPVAQLMMALEPDIFVDPKKLERWVLNHPEYQITRRTRRSS